MSDPQTKKTSGLAVASVILSAISFLCIFGPFASIPAVICGHIARGAIRREPERWDGDQLALVGVITGYINIVASIIAIGVFSLFIAQRTEMAQEARHEIIAEHCASIRESMNVMLNDRGEDFDPDVRETLLDEFKDACPSGGSFVYADGRFTCSAHEADQGMSVTPALDSGQ